MYKNSLDDTIAAISTPIGEGGIGIVRLSGSKALQMADEIFISKDGGRPSRFGSFTTHYGHVIENGKEKKVIDEVILTVMRAPKSYTKEDIVEINCHGGIEALKRTLGLVVKKGARMAEPGEFTKRAFLNGRIDLVQAEAVLDVIRAKTQSSLKAAMYQLDGDLSKAVEGSREEIIDIASDIEASIDFPDEEIDILTKEVFKKSESVLKRMKALKDTFEEGVVLREGVLAVICGKPNVGKSSLMNLLLKRDRVIVTPVPGTTRDAVEEMINIKGIPMRIVDTAGIVESLDMVEKEGVKRSKNYLEMADLVLLVLDASTKIEDKDYEIGKMAEGRKKIVVLNKMDLPVNIDRKKIKEVFGKDVIIEISVKSKTNIDILERTIAEAVWSGKIRQGEGAIVTNIRHKELLDKSFDNMLSVNELLKSGSSPELISVDLNEAIFNLGLIIGKSVSEDILDRIFDKFCIGK